MERGSHFLQERSQVVTRYLLREHSEPSRKSWTRFRRAFSDTISSAFFLWTILLILGADASSISYFFLLSFLSFAFIVAVLVSTAFRIRYVGLEFCDASPSTRHSSTADGKPSLRINSLRGYRSGSELKGVHLLPLRCIVRICRNKSVAETLIAGTSVIFPLVFGLAVGRYSDPVLALWIVNAAFVVLCAVFLFTEFKVSRAWVAWRDTYFPSTAQAAATEQQRSNVALESP
jgi:hypothetical protein